MLAVSSGDSINKSNLARSLDVSQPTIHSYLEIAEGTFLWRGVPSFARNARKRVVRMPKGHLRDTGLAAHLLGIHTVNQMMAHPHFGNLWQSFVSEQIIQGMKMRLITFHHYYYWTKDRAEVDLVLDGPFGVIPIEIKSGLKVDPRKIRALKNFIDEFDCPFGLVINRSNEVVKLAPRIVQIPATCL